MSKGLGYIEVKFGQDMTFDEAMEEFITKAWEQADGNVERLHLFLARNVFTRDLIIQKVARVPEDKLTELFDSLDSWLQEVDEDVLKRRREKMK